MNPSYEGGSSLLHIAARIGNRYSVHNICDSLAINNQSVIPKDDVGITPIHEAYFYGHYDIAKYILKILGTRYTNRAWLRQRSGYYYFRTWSNRNEYQVEHNITEAIIAEVEEMIDSTESGNFTGEPMEILSKLTEDSEQTVEIPYTEMIARNLLIELRHLFQTLHLSNESRPKSQTRQLERLNGSFVLDNFQKLSQMDNLTDETINLIVSIVPKIMETRLSRGAKGWKALYYITKMYFQHSVIPEEVWTNLQEHGYCSVGDWTGCNCKMSAKGDKQSQEVCTLPFVDDPLTVKHVVNHVNQSCDCEDSCQYCAECIKGDEFSSMITTTPWVASIGYISGSDWIHECTANIIGKNMIVTIAQCVENVDNSTQIKVGSEVFYDIESVDLHPDFSGTQFNIAIVYTTQNIEFSDKTRPICVPQFAEEDDDGLDGKAVRLSGWTPMGQQNRLVPIRDNSFCHPLDDFPNRSSSPTAAANRRVRVALLFSQLVIFAIVLYAKLLEKEVDRS